MIEPVSTTLAALAILEPAIKSVREAYSVYRLTRSFGEHYASVQRRLDGEQARLEISLDTNLSSMPDEKVLRQINHHLGLLGKHFQACQDLIASIDGHRVHHPNGSAATPDLVPPPSSWPTIVANPYRTKRKLKLLPQFLRKSDQASSRNEPSATTTSESTPTPSLNIPDEAVQAAIQQAHAAELFQSEATLTMKAKWVVGQKNQFNKHLEEIRASNDFIKDIVSMRTLGSIHNILVVPQFKGEIPKEVLSVQDSLHRLHHALNRSNHGSSETKPVGISIKVMEAAAYVQLRKRLTVQHDYVGFRDNSALYPLQVQPPTATSSTLILAETLMSGQETSASPEATKPLSGMLLDQSVDAYKAFELIGSVTETESSSESHRLYQDISASWTVRDTLADLIKSTSKFRTYIHLAAKVSVSYMYWASIGTSHQYPRLTDYRYYGLASEDKTKLKPDDVLEPYLSAGFGSRAPLRSTTDIGGTSGRFSGNEAMTGLGLILHQLGCWKMLDEQDLSSARDTARGERKDLQTSAGTSYADVVDSCLTTKDVEWERHACAASIYKKVVAPLQKLVSDLRWD